MESLLAALEATTASQYLRSSRLGYAALSGTHVLGIALLVGAIVPLNLRLLGLWSSIPRPSLLRVLVPVAATGFALAGITGSLLFAVRAPEYAAIPYLQVKLLLVFVALLSALAIHLEYGLTLDGASNRRARFHALLSLLCWLGALACGRMIAFAID